jgi:hypothetical protein
LQSVISAPAILIEPLWVLASKLEPGDKGADNWTVRSHFARMAQLPILIQQPAATTRRHSSETNDNFFSNAVSIFSPFNLYMVIILFLSNRRASLNKPYQRKRAVPGEPYV